MDAPHPGYHGIDTGITSYENGVNTNDDDDDVSSPRMPMSRKLVLGRRKVSRIMFCSTVTIDELKFWNRVLMTEEVQQVHNSAIDDFGGIGR